MGWGLLQEHRLYRACVASNVFKLSPCSLSAVVTQELLLVVKHVVHCNCDALQQVRGSYCARGAWKFTVQQVHGSSLCNAGSLGMQLVTGAVLAEACRDLHQNSAISIVCLWMCATDHQKMIA